MKKLMNLFLAICSISASISAYENSFFNNTNIPIGIAIQYTSNDGIETLYKLLVKPGAMVSFTPGKTKIPEIKWGFCLDNIYYIENPTTEQKHHDFEKTIWKKIPITWVEQNSSTKKITKERFIKQTSKAPTLAEKKSLCRDRHFDIIHDEHDKIAITASLND